MSQITNVEPSVFILDESTGQAYEGAAFGYDTDTGRYTLGNLPRNLTISITISFHVTGDRPTLPGNYYRYIGALDLSSLTAAQLSSYNIQIWELVHLLEPFDNANILPGFADPNSLHNSPLRFSWEPLEGATAYQITINRVRDAGHPEGYGLIDQIISILDLEEPTYLAFLADNAEHEHYEFDVRAWEPGRIIGSYFTTYESGFGGDYRFKITSERLAPAPPRNLSGVAGSGEVTLTWTAASETDVIRYRIYGGTTANPTTVLDSLDGVSNTEFVVRDLDLDNETYYFRVTSVNSALLESDFSNEVRFEPSLQNRPPVVNFALPDTMVALAGPGLSFDLTSPSDLFSDPDGDGLSYRTRSSNTSVASSSITGTVLAVNLLNVGTSQITVVAEDGRGGSDSTAFFVTVFRPTNSLEIMHDRVSDAPFDQPLTIRTTIDNASDVVSPVLYYRRGGDNSFTSVEMRLQGDEFTGLIPASVIGGKGLEYYIEVSDSAAVVRVPVTGFYAARIDIPENQFTSPSIGGSGAQGAYRLFSLPFDLDNKTPQTVFADFGEYDRSEWRLYAVGAGEIKMEFPNVSSIVPGKAYWVISKGSGRSVRIGEARTNLTDVPYTISLHPGWNLVGNPFDFMIPASNISLLDGSPAELRSFNGQWNDPISAPVGQMQPFDGYAVFNPSVNSQNLLVDPNVFPVSEILSPAKKTAALSTWLLRISASCRNAADADNILGIIPDSHQDWDEFDRPEPPTIGEYTRLYFPRQEWQTLAPDYCTDFRPEIGSGQIWEFEVSSNIADVTELDFTRISDVPPEYDVMLHDAGPGIVQDLRQDSHYTVSASPNGRRLRLVIGPDAFVQETLTEALALPKSFELSQNFPNPFNPSTTIGFGLPRNSNVTLSIYNVAGQVVNTLLVQEWLEAGRHTVIWDGKDLFGRRVGSGLFFYRLEADDFSLTRKMLLVR